MEEDVEIADEGETLPSEEHFIDDWPPRPWVLAGIGAAAGLCVHLLADDYDGEAWRVALAGGIFFAALAISFVLRVYRTVDMAMFIAGLGLVMGGISYLAVDSADQYAGEGFAFAAGVFFSLLAIPLFQADFHRRRWATPYAETHFHVWTDAVSAAGSLAFVLLSWILLFLLDALFGLVGMGFIEDLVGTDGFAGLFCGATFGAAMGVLRNQLKIIGTLQRVVLLVFSLLAVPFALAIALFLVILLFSGGSALWEATSSATPILLTCALGCFVLANAVFRDDDESRSKNVVMQAAALMLAASIFPLTVFAAISMGIRIDQYGLAPERIWSLVAIAIAMAYGLAYWVGLARGRLQNWAHYLRRANLHLAVVSCVVALVLAFPLVNFGSISANNQLARLQSGAVSAEEFDYSALRWDFGDAGREALARLAESDDAPIAQQAADALASDVQNYGNRSIAELREISENADLSGLDEATADAVRAYIRGNIYECGERCRVVELRRDEDGALLALIPGVESYRSGPQLLLVEPGDDRADELSIIDGRLWVRGRPVESQDTADEEADGEGVELRTFTGQRLYVDGEPASQPFE